MTMGERALDAADAKSGNTSAEFLRTEAIVPVSAHLPVLNGSTELVAASSHCGVVAIEHQCSRLLSDSRSVSASPSAPQELGHTREHQGKNFTHSQKGSYVLRNEYTQKSASTLNGQKPRQHHRTMSSVKGSALHQPPLPALRKGSLRPLLPLLHPPQSGPASYPHTPNPAVPISPDASPTSWTTSNPTSSPPRNA